jgi:hypothetical protein
LKIKVLVIGMAALYVIEWYLVTGLPTIELYFWNVWNSFWLEFFVLQVFIMYQIYKLFSEKNFFKMLISLLYFLILISIYLSVMQLELFACFLFLSEFIIIVFFYCLFLHLNYNNKPFFWTNVTDATFFKSISLTVVLVIWYLNKDVVLLYNINDLYLIFTDIYTFYNNYLMNDLVFLFFYFFHYNVCVLLFIGLFLLVMTMVLLYTVWLYVSLYLTRKNFLRSSFKVKITKVTWGSLLSYFI